MSLLLRALKPVERERAFKHSYVRVDLSEFREAVREMEGGVAYAIPVDGLSARQVKQRMTRAASALGLKLRYAKNLKDAAEVVVELAS